jgi:hypothetical protein
MFMLHIQVHTAWTWKCSGDVDMQREHGQVAWTGEYSTDMKTQREHGHGHRHGHEPRLLLNQCRQWTTLFLESFAEKAEVSRSAISGLAKVKKLADWR